MKRIVLLLILAAASLAGCASSSLSEDVMRDPWRCAPRGTWPAECYFLRLCVERGICL